MKARTRSSYAGRAKFSQCIARRAGDEPDFLREQRRGNGFPYSDSGSSRIRFTADLASQFRALCGNSAAGRASIVYACVNEERQPQWFSRERESWRPAWKRTSRVRDHPLEPHPFGRQRKRREKGPRRTRRALPNLLATGFLVCLQTRLSNRGCARHHAGFFFDNSKDELVPPRRS